MAWVVAVKASPLIDGAATVKLPVKAEFNVTGNVTVCGCSAAKVTDGTGPAVNGATRFTVIGCPTVAPPSVAFKVNCADPTVAVVLVSFSTTVPLLLSGPGVMVSPGTVAGVVVKVTEPVYPEAGVGATVTVVLVLKPPTGTVTVFCDSVKPAGRMFSVTLPLWVIPPLVAV